MARHLLGRGSVKLGEFRVAMSRCQPHEGKTQRKGRHYRTEPSQPVAAGSPKAGQSVVRELGVQRAEDTLQERQEAVLGIVLFGCLTQRRIVLVPYTVWDAITPPSLPINFGFPRAERHDGQAWLSSSRGAVSPLLPTSPLHSPHMPCALRLLCSSCFAPSLPVPRGSFVVFFFFFAGVPRSSRSRSAGSTERRPTNAFNTMSRYVCTPPYPHSPVPFPRPADGEFVRQDILPALRLEQDWT